MEFCRDFSDRAAPAVVCEYGVGKGDFAKTFLDEVKKRNKALYFRTRYYLFDFSEKMLEGARKNLKAHRGICIFGTFDALFDSPFREFDYCRINELLTDLPAQFFMRKGGRAIELLPGKGGAFSEKAAPSQNPVVSAYLARIEEGRAMPFNFSAEKFLRSLCEKGKMGFRIDLFDYGFYSADDVLVLPAEEWNRLMVRNYGGDDDGNLTVDMNFPQILSALLALGFPAKIEKQLDYAQRVLGKKLVMAQTKKGLDYAPSKSNDGIIEDDGFYHLRIGR